MDEKNAFALTLVRVGPFLPYVEAGVYEYLAAGLPDVGDTITITRIAGTDGATSDETRAFVTRVDGNATPPLMATEVQANRGPTSYRLGGRTFER